MVFSAWGKCGYTVQSMKIQMKHGFLYNIWKCYGFLTAKSSVVVSFILSIYLLITFYYIPQYFRFNFMFGNTLPVNRIISCTLFLKILFRSFHSIIWFSISIYFFSILISSIWLESTLSSPKFQYSIFSIFLIITHCWYSFRFHST